MPNILNNLKGEFLAPKLMSKLTQLRILGIRNKKTSCGSNEPPPGFPPPPGMKSRCPPSSQKDDCPQTTSPPPPPPSPSKPGCKLPSKNRCEQFSDVTLNDVPQPFGWYAGREMHCSSIYNRYLLAGLFMMTLSIYKFQTDKLVKSCMTNYQYMCDFDYDIDYKNLSSSVELSLVDVQNSHNKPFK